MRGARHRRQRQMMPLERTGAFTLACVAVLLVVVLAIAFLS
jgi:cytochrome c oxidase assembly factor CtaG